MNWMRLRNFPGLLGMADRGRSIRSYRALAAGYDDSCRHIRSIRAAAIERLAIEPGDTVFDVACGTGETLVEIAKRVGASGHVVGIEQCPEMALLARARVESAGLSRRVRLLVCPAEEARPGTSADSMLFCYTHDVLQTPAALANLRIHAKPGARVAVAGVRLLPWAWGWPLNLFTLVRTRRYLTTLRGLSRPWAQLQQHCPDLAIVREYHLGTSYLASGRFASSRL